MRYDAYIPEMPESTHLPQEAITTRGIRIAGPFVTPPVMSASTWRAFRYKWVDHLPNEARRPIGSDEETADWVRRVLSAPSLGILQGLGRPIDDVTVTVTNGRPAVEYDRQERHLLVTLSVEQTAPGLLTWHVAQGILSPDLTPGGLVHLLFASAIIRELFGADHVTKLAHVLATEKTTFKWWFGRIADGAGLMRPPEHPFSIDPHVLNERVSARAWLPQHLEIDGLPGSHSGYFPGRTAVTSRPGLILFRCVTHRHSMWVERSVDLSIKFRSPVESFDTKTVLMMEKALQEAWPLPVSAKEVA